MIDWLFGQLWAGRTCLVCGMGVRRHCTFHMAGWLFFLLFCPCHTRDSATRWRRTYFSFFLSSSSSSSSSSLSRSLPPQCGCTERWVVGRARGKRKEEVDEAFAKFFQESVFSAHQPPSQPNSPTPPTHLCAHNTHRHTHTHTHERQEAGGGDAATALGRAVPPVPQHLPRGGDRPWPGGGHVSWWVGGWVGGWVGLGVYE